jgi:hypothetical protein
MVVVAAATSIKLGCKLSPMYTRRRRTQAAPRLYLVRNIVLILLSFILLFFALLPIP